VTGFKPGRTSSVEVTGVNTQNPVLEPFAPVQRIVSAMEIFHQQWIVIPGVSVGATEWARCAWFKV
jgi:hypothetical protein